MESRTKTVTKINAFASFQTLIKTFNETRLLLRTQLQLNRYNEIEELTQTNIKKW